MSMRIACVYWSCRFPLTVFSVSLELISSRFDVQGEDEDEEEDKDDVISTAARRQLKRPAPNAILAAIETRKPYVEDLENALKDRSNAAQTSKSSYMVPTSASAPCNMSTNEEETQKVCEETLLSVQIQPHDKPGTFRLSDSKRRRLESSAIGEAANEVGQAFVAAVPSPVQSHQPSEQRRSEPHVHPKATNEIVQTNDDVKSSFTSSHPSSYQRPPVSDILPEPTGAVDGIKQTFPLPLMIPKPNGQTSPIRGNSFPYTNKTSIDAKKQSKTTLWILIPSSTDAVPLTLRSCMTMSSLFDSVFKICGIANQEQQDRVLGLRTTLSWMHGDVKRNVMLKREFEDSFATFLRLIDTSSCWQQENGGCSIAIEAVMA